MDENKDIIPLGRAIAIISIIVGVFAAIVILMVCLFYFIIGDTIKTAYSNSSNNKVKSSRDINLNGAWETENPNNNDEITTITFSDGSFVMVTEMTVKSDSEYVYEKLDDVEQFYDDFAGAPIVVKPATDGTMVRVTTRGTFSLNENEIEMVYDDGTANVLPFSHTENSISIDGEAFVRKD